MAKHGPGQSPIERCPNEVLLLIADELDLDDLFSAVLISRRLTPVFDDALYKPAANSDDAYVLLKLISSVHIDDALRASQKYLRAVGGLAMVSQARSPWKTMYDQQYQFTEIDASLGGISRNVQLGHGKNANKATFSRPISEHKLAWTQMIVENTRNRPAHAAVSWTMLLLEFCKGVAESNSAIAKIVRLLLDAGAGSRVFDLEAGLPRVLDGSVRLPAASLYSTSTSIDMLHHPIGNLLINLGQLRGDINADVPHILQALGALVDVGAALERTVTYAQIQLRNYLVVKGSWVAHFLRALVDHAYSCGGDPKGPGILTKSDVNDEFNETMVHIMSDTNSQSDSDMEDVTQGMLGEEIVFALDHYNRRVIRLKQRHTLLTFACTYNLLPAGAIAEMAQTLIEHGADPAGLMGQPRTHLIKPPMTMAHACDVGEFAPRAFSAMVNTRDYSGATPLHLALSGDEHDGSLKANHKEERIPRLCLLVLEILLRAGADPNLPFVDEDSGKVATDTPGWFVPARHTCYRRFEGLKPLYIAIDTGNLGTVRLLMASGADPREVITVTHRHIFWHLQSFSALVMIRKYISDRVWKEKWMKRTMIYPPPQRSP
ncbi:hypothetical protein B0H63DRAFT_447673 [Podospora didyma]|uniref:F-box domain-containing protein n=1 Tax=Podospora didyma TaxID=330526 RepID=A0AAE0NSE0_9PEZI|nr:hypothetical protein B0H63DRAFT_447673 [Podospora didyma]